MAAIALIASAFLAVVLIRLFDLRTHGEMYWGGEGGFAPRVLGSLAETWMYSGSGAGSIALTIV